MHRIVGKDNKSILVVNPDGSTNTKLTGSSVVISSVTYQVSNGNTLRNTAANRPTAANAHAAIPFCFYFAADTGVVSVTDGTTWRDV